MSPTCYQALADISVGEKPDVPRLNDRLRWEKTPVVVEVADSGIGIDSRIIQKIFVERGKSAEE